MLYKRKHNQSYIAGIKYRCKCCKKKKKKKKKKKTSNANYM